MGDNGPIGKGVYVAEPTVAVIRGTGGLFCPPASIEGG
jgi:hypothetical protein